MADNKHRGTDNQQSPRHTGPKQRSGEMSRIYSELRTSLMRFAYRYFKTPQDIEDVVQEAFIKVIEAKQHRDIEHPKAYMYQTVKNLSLNRLSKTDYRLTDSLEDAIGEGQPSPVLTLTPSVEEEFESRERFELFCRAVQQLPVKCQRVYILRRVYGFTQKEIAEQMDISIKTVEAHLTKAIVRCTDFMDSADSDNSEGHKGKAGKNRAGKNKVDKSKAGKNKADKQPINQARQPRANSKTGERYHG